MILSALTSVGYVGYYIVRCNTLVLSMAHGYKKRLRFHWKEEGRVGRGRRFFIMEPRPRAGMTRRDARGVGLIKRIDQTQWESNYLPTTFRSEAFIRLFRSCLQLSPFKYPCINFWLLIYINNNLLFKENISYTAVVIISFIYSFFCSFFRND